MRHHRRSQGFIHQSGGHDTRGDGEGVAVEVSRGTGALLVTVATTRGGTYSP
ncbi:MAG TPA: hypothetical protein VF069_17030 [Streptosporangiaceae bacterium]